MEPNCILHLSSLDLISSASRSLLLSSSRLHEDNYQGGEDVEGVEDNVDDDVDDSWDKDDHQNKGDKLCQTKLPCPLFSLHDAERLYREHLKHV